MGARIRPHTRSQMLLLPSDHGEWLLAYRVRDPVDALKPGALCAPYTGDGRRNSPGEPGMMVKALVYAYATGEFSTRRIARTIERDIAFRVLAAGNLPQLRTNCAFRPRHLADLERLFAEIVRLAGEKGLANFARVSIDGTTVRADASKRKAMSYGRMKEEEARLRREIVALLARAGTVDAEEDAELGAAVFGDDLPDALKRREARPEAEQRVRDRERGRQPDHDRDPKGGHPYKRPFGEPEANAQSNFTDPESAIMKTGGEEFQQCYNGQLVVFGKSQVIVAPAVDRHATNQGLLLPMLDAAAATVGRFPEEVLLVAGYCNEADLAELETRSIRAPVAPGREGRKHTADGRDRRPATHWMREHLATEKGRAAYAERKWLPEAPIRGIEQALGVRRLCLQGLNKMQGEWSLVCLAMNLRRMANLMAARTIGQPVRKASPTAIPDDLRLQAKRFSGLAPVSGNGGQSKPTVHHSARIPGSAAVHRLPHRKCVLRRMHLDRASEPKDTRQPSTTAGRTFTHRRRLPDSP